jgi:pyruvate decarboxylase
MNQVMQKLIKTLDYSRIRSIETPLMTNVIPRRESESTSKEITHAYFWPRVGQWLKEHDVVVTETYCSLFQPSL